MLEIGLFVLQTLDRLEPMPFFDNPTEKYFQHPVRNAFDGIGCFSLLYSLSRKKKHVECLRPATADADDPWADEIVDFSHLKEHKERYARHMDVDPSTHTHR